MAKAKRLNEAPPGGETFPAANPHYEGDPAAVVAVEPGEGIIERLRRQRLAGEIPMARSFEAKPDGSYAMVEHL